MDGERVSELECALAQSAKRIVDFWVDFHGQDPGQQASGNSGDAGNGTTGDDAMEKQREEAFRKWHQSLADVKTAGLISQLLEKDAQCANAPLVLRFLLDAARCFKGGMRKAAVEDLSLLLQVPSWSEWLSKEELESMPPDCRYLLSKKDSAAASSASTSDSDQLASEGAECNQQGDDRLWTFLEIDREHSREVEQRVKKSLGEASEKVCARGARIVIMGNAGAGKSSCINAAFHKDLAATGVGVSVTADITHYEATDECPIHIYDSKGFEGTTLNDDLRVQLQRLVQERRKAASRFESDHPSRVTERLHAVWWVVDVGAGGRFNPNLMSVVHDVFAEDSLPIIIIINKCDLGDVTYVNAIRRSVEEHCPWATAVVPVVAHAQLGPMMQQCPCGSSDIVINRKRKYHTCEECGKQVPFQRCYGIDALIRETADHLPEMVVLSLLTAQKEWLQGLDRSAIKIVAAYTFTAASIGATPLPFMSRFALVPLHLIMAASLAKQYDIIVSTKTSMHIVASVGSLALLGGVGCITANLLKTIPGLFWVGSISDAAISATVTASLGALFKTIFCRVRGKALLGSEVRPEDIDQVMGQEERRRFFHEYFEIISDLSLRDMSAEEIESAIERNMC